MKVLIDTPIWSLAFRKKKENNTNEKIINNLTQLIKNRQIAIIGSIRQEILSGISDKNKYLEIKNKMSVFSDHIIQTKDYEFAAECSNQCRINGIQGSHTDFLICAVAIKNDWKIFTDDADFFNYEKFIPIKLYKLN
ncbi:MAG: PIN domain-containing protein [Treponema sp.]|nr:PIN domain-containing protein [Treponema sp.]